MSCCILYGVKKDGKCKKRHALRQVYCQHRSYEYSSAIKETERLAAKAGVMKGVVAAAATWCIY